MIRATLLGYVPLIALLAWAVVEDLRHRRIPNWLTLAIAAGGVTQSLTAMATARPGQACLGFLAGFALTFALFALGALGGGDVKLMAAAGTWLGPWPILQVFLIAAVVGMCIVIGQCACRGRLGLLLRNSALLTINLVHLREVGIDHARATGTSCRSVDKPLPYAVPVLIATLGLLLSGKGAM